MYSRLEIRSKGQNAATEHAPAMSDAWRCTFQSVVSSLPSGSIFRFTKSYEHSWAELPATTRGIAAVNDTNPQQIKMKSHQQGQTHAPERPLNSPATPSERTILAMASTKPKFCAPTAASLVLATMKGLPQIAPQMLAGMEAARSIITRFC
jgi:hypothetical protein